MAIRIQGCPLSEALIKRASALNEKVVARADHTLRDPFTAALDHVRAISSANGAVKNAAAIRRQRLVALEALLAPFAEDVDGRLQAAIAERDRLKGVSGSLRSLAHLEGLIPHFVWENLEALQEATIGLGLEGPNADLARELVDLCKR